jgi:hypothetical protein
LVFNRLQKSGTNFLLEWFSQSNATYEIAGVTNLTSTNWVSLATLYPASSSNLTSFIDVGATSNKAKFYKVVQTGISIDLCDSNTATGLLNIPLDIGMPTNQPLTAVYLLLDGLSSMALYNPSAPFGNGIAATLDTTAISNGWHTLQAFVESGVYNESIGGVVGYSSQVVNLLVTNPITLYVPFTYGSTAPPFAFPIQAMFAAQSNQWTITVSTTNSPGTVLKSFSGSSTDGTAYVEWDGTDLSNNTYQGGAVGVTATISNAASGSESPLLFGSGSGSSVGPKIVVTSSMSQRNQRTWSLAYLGNNAFPACSDSTDGGQGFCHLFYDDTYGTDYGGLDFILQNANNTYFIANSNNNGWNGTAQIDNTNDWNNFWGIFTNASGPSCFFVITHGSPKALGNTGDTTTLADAQRILGNYRDAKGVYHINTEFYFGQFDGCDTVGWEAALGIPSQRLTVDFFTKLNVPPMACLTWSTSKIIGMLDIKIYNISHTYMITALYNNWLSGGGVTLQNALNTTFSGGQYGIQPVISGATDLPAP